MRYGNSAAELGATWLRGVSGNPLTEVANVLAVQRHITDYSARRIFSPAGTPLGRAATTQMEQGLELLAVEMASERAAAAAAGAFNASLQRAAGAARQALQQQEGAAAWAADLQLAGLELGLATQVQQQFGADAAQLSLLHYDLQQPLQGVDDLMAAGGGSKLAEGLAQGLPIMLRQAVVRVVQAADNVTVVAVPIDAPASSESGGGGGTSNSSGSSSGGFPAEVAYTAQYVVCTVPLGVLQVQGLLFEPEGLHPEMQAAIGRLGMGLVNHVALWFNSVSKAALP